MSLADDFDAIPVKGVARQIEYSEGPPTAEQAAYPRVEIAGTAAPASLADEFDALPVAQADAVKVAAAGAKPVSLLGRTFQGMRDPADAIAQMFYNAIPSGAQDSYRRLANALAEKTGMEGRIPEGGADAFLRSHEQQYQASRLAANGGKDPGFDGARMLGNLLSPTNIPLLAAMPELGALGLAGQVGVGAASGAVGSAMTPDTAGGNDFWKNKAINTGVGAAVGGVLGPVGNKIADMISPKTAPEVKALMAEGITPTPGQILGGAWKTSEDKLTSVPIIGDMIKNSQRRSVEDFNRAAYARALDPIGEASSANIGRAGVAEVKDKLGQAYDNLLPKLNFRADSQFSQEVGNLTAAINNGNVPPAVARQFESIVKNEVFSRMTKAGTMDGQNFKDLESILTQKIKTYGASPDPAHKDISAALSEVLKAARSNLERANPQYAGELGKINAGYANYTRLRQAAASVGAEEGIFTPAQLQSAVKALDKSAGKGNFATGNALLQDLSESGKTVLGGGYPDSGTPGRAMLAAAPGMAAAAYMNPLVASLAGIGGTAIAAPYTAMGQRLAAALLTRRPAGAESVANAVRAASPLLGVPLAPLFTPAPKN